MCVSEAGGLEALYQDNVDRGGVLFEILVQDNQGGDVSQQELEQWADTYGLTMPVLSDEGMDVIYSFATGSSIGLPFTVIVDHGVVVDTNYPSDRDWESLLE